jgi:acetyltransferase-like isoleucine patch superfamily enzyme
VTSWVLTFRLPVSVYNTTVTTVVALAIQRAQSELYVRTLRRRGIAVSSQTRLIGRPLVQLAAHSSISIGARARIISTSRRTALGVNHATVLRTLLPNASISIGEDVGISGGSICAAIKVVIGDGTMLGANVLVVDTDFHELVSMDRRYRPVPPPQLRDSVEIGTNVFVGSGAIILKGVTIGDNAVVGAGAVVTRSVLSGQLVAGNPARPVRDLFADSR